MASTEEEVGVEEARRLVVAEEEYLQEAAVEEELSQMEEVEVEDGQPHCRSSREEC